VPYPRGFQFHHAVILIIFIFWQGSGRVGLGFQFQHAVILMIFIIWQGSRRWDGVLSGAYYFIWQV
jgi:hypothetical protein